MPIFFADDSSFYKMEKNIEETECKVNIIELIEIMKWLEVNKLTLNVDKIDLMHAAHPEKM